MNFRKHFDLEGRHAFLSASKYSWKNYDLDTLDEAYRTQLAHRKGTELHEIAAKLIKMGLKQPSSRKTFNMYVNECIGFRMEPEVVLFASTSAFGTADAISFRKNLLRISDLKTGLTPAKFDQLEIYAAFFCIEYGISPMDIEIELRIYQNDAVTLYQPDADDIFKIMDKTKVFTRRIDELQLEAE